MGRRHGREGSMTLGDLRRRSLLTQRELAEEARLGLSTVARLEQGNLRPSIPTLRLLAQVLGPKVYSLRYGWKCPFPAQRGIWAHPPKRRGPNKAIRLRDLRRVAGLNQRALARAARIGWQTVVSIERGITRPRPSTLACLERVLPGASLCEYGWSKPRPSPSDISTT